MEIWIIFINYIPKRYSFKIDGIVWKFHTLM